MVRSAIGAAIALNTVSTTVIGKVIHQRIAAGFTALTTVPGGRITFNEKDPLAYLGRRVLEMAALAPLRVTSTQRKFDVSVKVIGGGSSGQAGAIAHGIARALINYDPDFRPALKKAGLLTRDARMKERKKYGLKRARKAPQYTKR